MGTTFGSWLKQRRKELGVAQDELAERIGCSEAMLWKIEAGRRHPSSQIAHLLAYYFRIPTDEHEAFVAFARSSEPTTEGSGIRDQVSGTDGGPPSTVNGQPSTVSPQVSPNAPWRG